MSHPHEWRQKKVKVHWSHFIVCPCTLIASFPGISPDWITRTLDRRIILIPFLWLFDCLIFCWLAKCPLKKSLRLKVSDISLCSCLQVVWQETVHFLFTDTVQNMCQTDLGVIIMRESMSDFTGCGGQGDEGMCSDGSSQINKQFADP